MPARPPLRPAFTALAGLLALAACADDAPPPPTVSGGRTTAATASAPAARGASGPVTTFDGRYSGTVTLNPDRTRRCPDGPPSVEMTVRAGRAALVINPTTRQTLSGTVGPDGTVRMVDIVDRAIMTTGIVNAQGFVGEHRNGLCSYAVNLPKVI